LKTRPVLSPKAREFVDPILALRPSLAVFDCDGTLWSGDAGADFFYWELERGLIPGPAKDWIVPRYRDYKSGRVDEEVMCGEMVTINAGISEQKLEEEAERFFVSLVEPRIFPEMLYLTHALAESGCELWAVSSTNLWTIAAGLKRFGISRDHILAACVHTENGVATDRLIRVPSGPAKASAINEVIGRPVSIGFGNSIHDRAMLEIAQKAVAVNPNPDLEEVACRKGWTIYWPQGTAPLSMKRAKEQVENPTS
jgi:phosphoserine phosphatase